MRFFCTYFDENYIPQGQALLYSIKKYHKNFHMFVCPITNSAESLFKKLRPEDTTIINPNLLEKFEPKLKGLKKQRSKVEFYFTCTPVIISYVLKKYSLPYVEYIDSDMFFFSSSERLFKKLKKASVAITPHRFARTEKIHLKYGKYNVGWMFFKNNLSGKMCLKWWTSQCLKWCYDRVEKNRYADQKYLDQFPKRFKDVISIEMSGFNEAPWNVDPKKVKIKNKEIFVGRFKLILYHFSGLKKIFWRIYDPCWSDYHVIPSHNLVRHVYQRYLRCIFRFQKKSIKIVNLRKESSLEKIFKTKGKISALNEIRKRLVKKIYLFCPFLPSFRH